MLACLRGMLVSNLHRRDLAVRYSARSVRLSCSLRLGWEKILTGAAEVKWVNTSWKEMEWEERDQRTVQEWCQNPTQELRSSGKTMEVCCSSYRQNLVLNPIAVHFLNLETSATRLARALLVRSHATLSVVKKILDTSVEQILFTHQWTYPTLSPYRYCADTFQDMTWILRAWISIRFK